MTIRRLQSRVGRQYPSRKVDLVLAARPGHSGRVTPLQSDTATGVRNYAGKTLE